MAARTKLLIALASILALSAAGVGIYLHQAQDAARMSAHYEALRNQRDYRAETVACSNRVPSGDISRVTAYDESFRWRDNPAQLQRQKERFPRAHRQFYLVEAARDLGAGHVLILRRFGPLLGEPGKRRPWPTVWSA